MRIILAAAVLTISIIVFAFAQEKRPPNIKHINPPTLSTPTGYTHVVEVTGGRTIYIAGQVGADKSGKIAGDFNAQVKQAFENLKAALAGAGATFENVVKMNTYATDLSQIQALREIRAGYFGNNPPPANTLVQVVRLARPEYMIEIEAIAVVP